MAFSGAKSLSDLSSRAPERKLGAHATCPVGVTCDSSAQGLAPSGAARLTELSAGTKCSRSLSHKPRAASEPLYVAVRLGHLFLCHFN